MKRILKPLSMLIAVALVFSGTSFAIQGDDPPITRAMLQATPNSAGWYNQDIAVQVTATDPGTYASGIRTVEYETDESSNKQTGTVPLTGDQGLFYLVNNGVYSVTVTAFDYAGNAGSQSLSVKLDKELPMVTNATLEKAGPLQMERMTGGDFNEKVRITASASDQVSGLDKIGYKLDGASEYTYLESGINEFLVDHEYRGSVNIVAVDIAGNISEPYIIENLVVDATLPEIQIRTDVPANAYGWYSADIDVHFDVSDDNAIKSVEYTTDEAENPQHGSGAAGSNTITLRNNGEYTLTVTATDNSDNTTSESLGVKLDKELPVITNAVLEETGPLLMARGGNYDQQVKITVSTNDAVSGIYRIGYRLDGASEYTLLDSGMSEFVIDHAYSGTISIIAIDYAGNQSAPYEINNMVIENTPPTLDINFATAPNEYGWHNGDAVINVSAKDEGDVVSGLNTVSYTTDETVNPQSGTVTLTDGNGSFTLQNEGVYTVTVTASDNSGNITTATLNVKIDKISPTVTLNAVVESSGVQVSADVEEIKNAVDVSEDMQNDALSEIQLKLQVDKMSAPESRSDERLAAIKLNGKTPAYLDINLLKSLKATDQTVTTEKVTTTEQPIAISVVLDGELSNKYDYSVIRVHDGVAETLESRIANGKITFSTDRFSTYAIGYRERPVNYGRAFASSKPITIQQISFQQNTVASLMPRDGMEPAVDSNTVPYYMQGGEEIIAPISAMGEDGSVRFLAPVTAEYYLKSNAKDYMDISGHWASGNIMFVSARELFNGIGEGVFAPDAKMTRAMFIAVLARLEGEDLSGYMDSGFTDVPADAWYASYVSWAVSNGIANGVGNDAFLPDRVITREEMAIMLDNYIKYQGYSLTASNAAEFSDADQISNWAVPAVIQIQQYGIIDGHGNNQFAPKDGITRAEATAIFSRLIQGILNQQA